MALTDDVLKLGAVPALAVGAVALAIPVLFPSMRRQWAVALKAGASVFFEAEGGAEGVIIDKLAERAIDQIADAVANLAPEDRDRATGAIVTAYKAKARHRARRHGWSEQDREARYRRQITHLHRIAARRAAHDSDRNHHLWSEVESRLRAAGGEPQPAPIGTKQQERLKEKSSCSGTDGSWFVWLVCS